MVGLGGIWVEVLADSAVRALPVSPGDVREMLTELKCFPLLTGAHGAEPVDLDELSRVIARIGAIAVALGDVVEELEINPCGRRDRASRCSTSWSAGVPLTYWSAACSRTSRVTDSIW